MNRFQSSIDTLPIEAKKSRRMDARSEERIRAVQNAALPSFGYHALAALTMATAPAHAGATSYQIVKAPFAHHIDTLTHLHSGLTKTQPEDDWMIFVPSITDNWPSVLSSGQWAYQAAQRLDLLASRPQGWKHEDSQPPSQAVLRDANILIRRLAVEGCQIAPMISSDVSGDIIFYWRNGQAVLSLSLDGGGSFSYFLDSEHETVTFDDYPLENPIPKAFFSLLTH
jgi:hypothetical protein